MIIIRKLLFLILVFQFSLSAFAQNSCHLRISILTCSPGEELYSTFGHSALRLKNDSTGEDVVFNYGTFDFDEPGFYTKFIRGKLTFYLSTEDFESFIQFYKEEKRRIIEQVLNLDCSEKNKIVQLLQNNLSGANKFYKYDFTFDNCTTRLRDLLEKTAGSTVRFAKIVNQKSSFRDLIYEYLNYNDKQWSKLGIDILLGARTDAIMDNRQAMFLPDYLMKAFDSSTIGGKAIVLTRSNLYSPDLEKGFLPFYENPFFIFSVVLLVIAFLSLSKSNSIKIFLTGFDGFLFFIIGLLGLLLIFMWTGTDHIMCKDNYNLLWAWPTHAFAASFINSKKKYAIIYFKITAIVTSYVLAAWFFLPEHMNTSLIPIVILIIFRAIVNGFRFNAIKNI